MVGYERVLIGLQGLQVLFLIVHDWVPLGRLNDVTAVRSQDTTGRLVGVTLLQTLPFAALLSFSVQSFGHPYPHGLMLWLWIGYGVLFAGQMRAWWVPYLVAPDPVRAARYEVMFGKTHTYLPKRNGMVPNTAHMLLHAATLATLLVLALMTLGGR